MAVVSRWFGGTLLGAGGLVRAYGDAVRAGLAATGTRERALVREFRSASGMPTRVGSRASCAIAGVAVLDTSYGAEVALLLGVSPSDQASLRTWVAALTAGAVAPEPVGERWVDL